MTTYMITGATGGYGSQVLDYLIGQVPTENLFALVRSEEKGKDLAEKGITIRVGDYSKPDSLEQAFRGIDKLLFVSGVPGNRQEEHKNVIEAAKKAGVSFIAYTSLAGIDDVAKDFALGDDHRFTEQLLKESGIAYTSLRNNWYLENELPLLSQALTSHELSFATEKDTKVAWVSRKDLAEAGAKVLLADAPKTILELSGHNRTYGDLAQALSQMTDTTIPAKQKTIAQVADVLVAAGLPQETAQELAGLQEALSAGFLESKHSDLEETLGRTQTPLVDSLSELLN